MMDTKWMRELLDRYDRLHQDLKAFNAPQDFYLALIRYHRMNGFNGPRIADWLDDHRDHWQAVYLGPDDTDDIARLLSDQTQATLGPVDSLYILTDGVHVPDILDALGPDEHKFIHHRYGFILRLWWD